MGAEVEVEVGEGVVPGVEGDAMVSVDVDFSSAAGALAGVTLWLGPHAASNIVNARATTAIATG